MASYSDRLVKLGLVRLNSRRLSADHKMMNNIVHGKIVVNFNKFFVHTHERTRGLLKYWPPFRPKNNVSLNWFAERSTKVWNSGLRA